MTPEQQNHMISNLKGTSTLKADLARFATAWNVTAHTPDDKVILETEMARGCARALVEIERLEARLAELEAPPTDEDVTRAKKGTRQ